MKIEVAKPDLETALQVVSIGSSSSGNDLTTHFVFRHRDKDNGVEVLSNNNRIGCSMPIQGVQVMLSEDANAFTVESWRLNKWLSAVEDSVLTLEYQDGVVKATSPKGSVKFQSLDPEQFSYWDKTLGETGTSTMISAKRLQIALSHVKLFISDKDTTQPKLGVTEIKKAALQATDKGALALVALAGLDDSNIRIHGKDLTQVLAFLSQSGDHDIEIKEHDRCLFLVRHDGGVLSVGRPPHAFPDINIDRDGEDPHYWDLHKEDVVSSINALAASASKEDTRVTFTVPKEGIIGISMMSTSGEEVSMHLETQSHTIPSTKEGEADTIVPGWGAQEDAPEIPKEGFGIAYPYLIKLLGQWKNDVIRFGINPQVDSKGKSKGGWVRFREDRDGDDFLTLLVWLV